MKGLCAMTLIVLAGCGGSDSGGGATTPGAGTLPAAKTYVAMGVTNSYIGPHRTIIVARGTAFGATQRGDAVIEVAAGDAAHLFALVAGSRRIATPQTPKNCSDCGTAYAEADGAYFTPSAAFTAEFERLRAAPGTP